MGSQLFEGLIPGLWGDAGQNFVDLQGGKSAVFGTRPKVANFTPVNLSDETGKAVAGNLANYDSITALLDKIIPGFSSMLSQGTANTLSELQGQLPADVAAQVQRSAAYQALQGGYSGTGMAKALSARDLGLTSLNLTQMGNNSAQLWSNVAESAYSPFTVSTGQQAATTAANNAGLQAQQQYQYNVNAAPDPGALGTFNIDAALGQQMLSLGMGAIGGIGGGGAAGGSAQVSTQNTNPYVLMGGQGNAPAYQYNPSTGQYGQVPQAQPVGAWQASDRRLKKDVLYVKNSSKGFGIYEFSYRCHEGPMKLRYRGVMADEILLKQPEAVQEVDGFMMVDYGAIGVPFEVVI